MEILELCRCTFQYQSSSHIRGRVRYCGLALGSLLSTCLVTNKQSTNNYCFNILQYYFTEETAVLRRPKWSKIIWRLNQDLCSVQTTLFCSFYTIHGKYMYFVISKITSYLSTFQNLVFYLTNSNLVLFILPKNSFFNKNVCTFCHLCHLCSVLLVPSWLHRTNRGQREKQVRERWRARFQRWAPGRLIISAQFVKACN